MPLPRVTKPTIGSGGAGLQQRARPVISRSTPTIEDAAAGARGLALPRQRRLVFGAARAPAPGLRAPRGSPCCNCAQVDLVARDRGEEIVELGEARLRGDRVELERGHARALQLALDHRAPVRDRLLELLRLEPLPHLGARAVAVHVAELGVQPVARRAALLRRDDLDPLAVLEQRS